MKHLRVDYQSIQDHDHSTSIEKDEPVFIVRAKDRNAPQTVRLWAAYTLRDGGSPEMCARVQEWADEMDAYREQHFSGGKVADVPNGMLLPSDRIQVPTPRFCPHCGQPLDKPHAEDCAHVRYIDALESQQPIALH